MTRVQALGSYQFKLQLRNFKGIFFAIVFPTILFLIFSNLLSGSLNPDTKIDIKDYLVPSYIPIIVINTLVMTFGFLMVSYKEHKYFIKYKLLGLKPIEVAGSLFLAVFLFQVVGILLLVFVAYVTKGVMIPYRNMLNVIVTIIIINVFEFSLAFFLGAIIGNSGTYQAVAMILFYYQMFLGGLTFPPEMFNPTVRAILEFVNPIIHGLYIMRGVWTEGQSVLYYMKEIGILMGLSMMMILMGSRSFKWE